MDPDESVLPVWANVKSWGVGKSVEVSLSANGAAVLLPEVCSLVSSMPF